MCKSYCQIVVWRSFILSFFMLPIWVWADSLTQQELDMYFKEFMKEFPVVKFSGFFHNDANPKTGIHISNCQDNMCEISYNDYSDFKQNFAPIPECKSAKKIEIVDSYHARVGNAVMRIEDNKMRIYGSIMFECEPHKITHNLVLLQAVFDSPLHAYELEVKDVILEAAFPYPVNLDCLNRLAFSEAYICAQPLLSDTYGFGQFFIFLASKEPQSFHVPHKTYTDYKIMQKEIAMCQHSKRHTECIHTALGKFETNIRNNIMLNNDTPHILSYHLLQ